LGKKILMAVDRVYKIGTLARECGISPHLLRAWERRYNLLNPNRGPGRQRLFNNDDLLLLRYLSAAIKDGARIGELAALGRKRLLIEAHGKNVPVDVIFPAGTKEDPPAAFLTHHAEQLVAAAENVDGPGLGAVLATTQMELSTDKVVYEIILQAMQQVGAACLAGTTGIAGEHLISNLVEQYLKDAIETAHKSAVADSRPVAICCCFPGEEHRIGLLTVAYALARQGWRVVFLGSSMPLTAVEQGIQQIQPESVWLSVSDRVIYRRYRNELADLVLRQKKIRFVVGGQGIADNDKHDKRLIQAGCELCPPLFRIPEDVYRLTSSSMRISHHQTESYSNDRGQT
jgi:MerR family transcriptional regulator, light-induced transcriptional regulator